MVRESFPKTLQISIGYLVPSNSTVPVSSEIAVEEKFFFSTIH